MAALVACAVIAAEVEGPASAQNPSPYSFSSDGPGVRKRTAQGSVLVLRDNVWLRSDDLAVNGDEARLFEDLEELLVLGNVHAVTESLTLWCDSLRVYDRRDLGIAMGSVRVETLDGALGSARRGEYDRARNWLSLVGGARVIDEAMVVSGDSIFFDRPQQRMEAFRGVKIVDEGSSTVIRGEHALFDEVAGVAIVDSVPHLTSRRQGSEETTVTSRWMSFSEEGDWSKAIGNVDFRQGSTLAHADTATFLGEDLLILEGSPQVDQGHQVMSGDEIQFHYKDQVIDYVEVFGSAQLVDSTPDTLAREFASIPLQNTLSGDTLRIHFEDGLIRRTEVFGSASSTFLPDDQSASISVNEVTGDQVAIDFSQGRVARVHVKGNVNGVYRFLERSSLEASVDSTATDSTAVAVTAEPDSTGAPRLVDFDTSAERVEYTGDEVEFLVTDQNIDISGNARVQHGTLVLTAQDIRFDTATRELLAEGDPLLVDRQSELVGDKMGYLFEPQTGAVQGGATRFDDGYYTGKHIRRVDSQTLLVSDGTYTSCDLAEPHYHFAAKRMKLKVGEQVVARQVTFKVSDIPLLTLPFYYKSLDSGRHSGILFPNVNLGFSSREGRYIRDLGYYWATNDYTDFKFELDYNERNDATFTVENQYNVRYGMSGRARFDYLRRFSSTQEGDEWKLVASHRQPELFEVWNAQANAEISSSSITNNNLSSDNRNELIDTQLRSTGSVSRTFDNGMSLNLSIVRNQFVNAEDDDKLTNNVLYRQTLPRFSVGVKTRSLVAPAPRGEDGNLFANILRNTQFRQSYSGQVDREKKEESLDDEVRLSGNFGLSYAPQGRVGPFVLTSSAAFSEAYTHREFSENRYGTVEIIDPSDSTVTEVVVLEEVIDETTDETTPSLSFSNSLRTDLYGIFDTNLGPVRGIKHKVSYSMSHNFRPELGSKQIRSQNFSFSLTNELSLKVLDDARAAADSTAADGEEPQYKKLNQLVRWSLSSSYNPEAQPDRRWSDISSGILIRPGVTQAVSLDLNQTIDPYTFDVKSTRIQTGLRLQGSLGLGGGLSKKDQPKNVLIDRLPKAEADSTRTEDDEEAPGGEDFYEYGDPREDPWLETSPDGNAIPWTFNARASLTQTRNVSTGTSSTRATISTNASVRLPGEWQFTYSAGFDVESGEFVNQFFSLRRDIHNWSLEFNRGITDGQDFGFKLYLRDIPDLEVRRGRRNAGDMLGRLGQY